MIQCDFNLDHDVHIKLQMYILMASKSATLIIFYPIFFNFGMHLKVLSKHVSILTILFSILANAQQVTVYQYLLETSMYLDLVSNTVGSYLVMVAVHHLMLLMSPQIKSLTIVVN